MNIQENINFNTPNRNEILKNGFKSNTKKNLIGSGSYGTVIKGFYKNKNVAVKIIEKTNEAKIQAVKNEYNILGLEHENITTTLKIETTKLYSIIIMETFPGHCLQYLIDNIEISLRHRLNICMDIISGLNFCHSNGIVHFDLKPKNILISYLYSYNQSKKYVCKLCDFGSSIKLSRHQEYPKNMGTLRYMAPEILKMENLSTACDIYSFGITMWQLKARLYPYFQIDSHEVVAYKVVKDNLRPSLIRESNNNKDSINKLDCFCDNLSSNCNVLNNINPLKINQVNFPETLLNPQIYNASSKQNRSPFKTVSNQIATKKEKNASLSENKHLIHKHFIDTFIFHQKFAQVEGNYDKLLQHCWVAESDNRPTGRFIQNQITEFLISTQFYGLK